MVVSIHTSRSSSADNLEQDRNSWGMELKTVDEEEVSCLGSSDFLQENE